MEAAMIERLISAAFPGGRVRVIDLAGDGDHYAVEVTASAFAGKSRVAQHQMVYAALGERLRGELHALSVRTFVENGPEGGGTDGTQNKEKTT